MEPEKVVSLSRLEHEYAFIERLGIDRAKAWKLSREKTLEYRRALYWSYIQTLNKMTQWTMHEKILLRQRAEKELDKIK
jgi:hypothetical protein